MKNSGSVLVVIVAIGAIVGLLAVGCAPAATPTPTAPPGAIPTPTSPPAATPTLPPAAKKVVTIATGTGCSRMAVSEAGASGACSIQIAQMYQQLCWMNHDGEIVPELATSWELINPTLWEFKLREGVKWHNGDDFTAEDVKFTYDAVVDPDQNWAVRANVKGLENVEVVDDYTVRFHFTAPKIDFPFFQRSIYIIPAKHTQEVGYDDLWDHPVGNGPFKFVEFVPGDHITLEAYDDYWKERPKIDELVWRWIPEKAGRVAALLAGEVDIIPHVPLDLIPVVEADPNLHLEDATERLVLTLWMDTLTDSPVADKRVRQAIDYAIDKEAIWESLMGGLGAVNCQMLTPDVFGYNPNVECRPYDPEKATELLAEAGYADGLDLEVQTYVGKYFVDYDACIAIADQLAKVGINLKVNGWDQAVIMDYFKNPDKRSDMIYWGWYSYGNPAFAMCRVSKDAWSMSKWKNDEYDELFDVATTTLDEDERLAAYYRMAEIIYEEVPIAAIARQPARYGVNNRVLNWRAHHMQCFYMVDADVKQ